MEPTDLTIEILREIRNEISKTNERLDRTNERLDRTNDRLEQTRVDFDERFDVLGKRLVESDMRTATALVDLAGAVREVRTLLSERLDVRDRLVKCEADISELKKRVGM